MHNTEISQVVFQQCLLGCELLNPGFVAWKLLGGVYSLGVKTTQMVEDWEY